jgi:prolyl oligopeptidase
MTTQDDTEIVAEAPPGAQAPAADMAAAPTAAEDPFLWLEEVEGERALEWVRAQNARSLAGLEADPRFAKLNEDALAIIRARDRLTFGGLIDGQVSNFWQDDQQVRGVWRRATLDSWKSGSPRWETILDIDALARTENANWVFAGQDMLDPNVWNTRTLISLSDGGKDASTVREFDLATRRFVEGGFKLPEAKSSSTWLDRDTILVGTDWGPGTMTESGYPFIVKALRRGQTLDQATEVFRGQASDVYAGAFRVDDGTRMHHFFLRAPTFFTVETSYRRDDGTVVRLDLPARHAIAGLRDGLLFLTIQEDWTPRGSTTTLRKGGLYAVPFQALLTPGAPLAVQTVFVPGDRESLQGAAVARDGVFVTMSRNVRGEVRHYVPGRDGAWTFTRVALPENGVPGVVEASMRDGEVFFSYNDFLTPPSILRRTARGVETVQAQPPRFNAADLVVEQREATSRDGTKVPYFVVRRRDTVMNGQTPTLLYGYGGFEVTMDPSYNSSVGRLWLERGGAYVLANIRGGGEFGPAWHQAGLRTNRQVIFDDFIAVAESLVSSGLTTPRRLGAMGGSNGGLLMGVMLTQRPDLFNAVVVQVPLLDMLRFHLLLAGASWIDEYGDPDVAEERAWLERMSPYHNLTARPDMPVPFFVTSTKDDRVHPGHARKFAARMEALGMPFFYYENIDGGHSAAANLVEAARRRALEFTYLSKKLMD